tara:strand:- start:955 stop:1869 length:915 start_codon:yes stop_codon:yes gene_type:complete
MDLSKLITESRNIKPNSLNAYLIALKKLNNGDKIEDLKFLENKKEVNEKLDKLALSTQKNYLTAVLVALQAVEEPNETILTYYRDKLDQLNTEYNNKIKTNSKSETQEKNWTTIKELNKIRRDYEKEVKNYEISTKEKLTPKNKHLLQEYLVASLYTLKPPIRLDYAPMEVIKDEKKAKEGINYLINKGRNKKYFLIQEFKTSKKHGTQKMEIPPALNTIINLWLKHNDTPYFLLNARGEALSANGLGKLITKVFKATGKQITLNILRHVYISEHVDLEAIKKQADLAKDMMHSVSQQQDYAKV